MAKSINLVLANFFNASTLFGKACADLIEARKSGGYRKPETFRPIVMQAASKFYGVPIVIAERGTRAGQEVFSQDHKSYEAAKKAVNRALAVAFDMKGKGNNKGDPVARIEKSIEKLAQEDKAALKRLIKWLREEGHL
jgi:hypothetical protein